MKHNFLFFIAILTGFFLSASAQAYQSPFPDTGQTKCYNNSQKITCPSPGQPFYGQDAQYRGRFPRSYTKLGYGGMVLPDSATHVDDGGLWIMIRDDVTGLIWELKTKANRDQTYTWLNAKSQHIAGLNSAKYGGFDDWRLPDVKELSSLVNAADFPAIDSWFRENIPNTCWSSTTYAYNVNNAWSIVFSTGSVGYPPKSYSSYVRAVRSGPPPQLHFIDNLDGTVTDMAMGLMWQKCTYGQVWSGVDCIGNPVTKTWQGALEAAESLTWANHSDWRLPNRNELQSLVNYSRVHPASYSLFTSMPSNYWSSTTFAHHPGTTWTASFNYGSYGVSGKPYSHYIRAVRTVRGRQSGAGSFDSALPAVFLLLLDK